MIRNRKQQIIETAARLFKEKGYRAVSMRDLAEEMGLQAASLYNHIKSKDEIVELIIMDLVKDFTGHIDELAKQDSSSREKIKIIIQKYVKVTFEKTNFLACMNKEWRFLNEECKTEYLRQRAEYENHLIDIINSGIKNREIRYGDSFIMAKSILSMLRTLYHWYEAYPEVSEEILTTNIQENILWGIGSREEAQQ